MIKSRRENRFKLDRRTGVNILSKSKSPIYSRNYPAGQHGKTARRTNSEYGKRLMEIAKLKHFYGDIRFSYLKSVFKSVAHKRGRVDDHLIGILESRLSQMVYRAKFVNSPYAARQLVSHKHVMVNGKIVNIGSYRVSVGDTVELVPSIRNNPHITASMSNNERQVPNHILMESPTKFKVIAAPNIANTNFGFALNLQAVVEFMSKYV